MVSISIKCFSGHPLNLWSERHIPIYISALGVCLNGKCSVDDVSSLHPPVVHCNTHPKMIHSVINVDRPYDSYLSRSIINQGPFAFIVSVYDPMCHSYTRVASGPCQYIHPQMCSFIFLFYNPSG